MRIAVIGSNSFIARNFIYFIKESHPEINLDLYDFQDEHLDGFSKYKKINILDKNLIDNIDFNVDLLYLFAGKTGTLNGFNDYDSYIDINEKGLLNILSEYKKQSSTAKIIFPSSRLVYKGLDRPLREDDEKEFKTIYAMNKFACEQYLSMYNSLYGIPYVVFRICVPYGSMIPNVTSYGTAEFMLKKALAGENISLYGQGEVRRTLVNIRDLCEVLYLGAITKDCLNDVYNIGGEDYSLYEMAKAISEKYNIGLECVQWPVEALKIESGSTVFNSEKLDKIIGYKYKNTFQQWIKEG